jgi:alpha-aminoadipic semialdehyde synthase
MAKCVGLPTAIAARLILDGNVKEKGIVRPTIPSLYNPILHTLREEGVQLQSGISRLTS